MITWQSILEKKWVQKTFLLISLISCLYLGYLMGQTKVLGDATSPTVTPIFTKSDTHQKIATLSILGTYDHAIYATSTGGPLRIMSDGKMYTPDPDAPFGLFVKDNPELGKTDTIIYDNPCILMASPTGKYVYIKNDPKADNLKEPRCFTSLNDALESGYILKE